jgi:hypothetical protein
VLPASRPAFIALTMPPPERGLIMCAASPAISTPSVKVFLIVVCTMTPPTV